MLHVTHSIRVRYAETDSMKYVYYGNYATYLEVARVELFRSLGISYDQIEKQGILMPVSDYKIRYFRPALYDQILKIETTIKELPKVRICFDYKIFNESEEKISSASTTLFFLNAETRKIIRCPEWILSVMKNYFI